MVTTQQNQFFYFFRISSETTVQQLFKKCNKVETKLKSTKMDKNACQKYFEFPSIYYYTCWKIGPKG